MISFWIFAEQDLKPAVQWDVEPLERLSGRRRSRSFDVRVVQTGSGAVVEPAERHGYQEDSEDIWLVSRETQTNSEQR